MPPGDAGVKYKGIELHIRLYSFDHINDSLEKLNIRSQSLLYEISDCGVRVFSRKNPGILPESGHPINQVRESLFYRIKAIVYHVNILINQRKSINDEIVEHFKNGDANPISIERLIIHQYYLFDDIIFNLLSMFDYISAMLGFMFDNRYYKWNSLVRSARNNSTTIGKENFSKEIVKLHSTWVDTLLDYRSDLIHKSPKFGEDTINKGGFKRKIPDFTIIRVDPKMTKIIQKFAGDIDQIDIIDCSIVLCTYSFAACNDLLLQVK